VFGFSGCCSVEKWLSTRYKSDRGGEKCSNSCRSSLLLEALGPTFCARGITGRRSPQKLTPLFTACGFRDCRVWQLSSVGGGLLPGGGGKWSGIA
jgi:hypothetical protein